MPWSRTSPEVYQSMKECKAILARHTPNKAAAAEIIGVRPSTVDGWCNPAQINPSIPLALVHRHPAARELLEYYAHQIGYTLTPVLASQNGRVDDELMSAMVDLGQVSERLQAALKDYKSPGRVDASEAVGIIEAARQLQDDATLMISELEGLKLGDLG